MKHSVDINLNMDFYTIGPFSTKQVVQWGTYNSRIFWLDVANF